MKTVFIEHYLVNLQTESGITLNFFVFFQNLFSGILIILLCSTGKLSNIKAQGILLLSLVVTVVNLVNLVILEVGEWRGFLSQTDKDFIEENGFEHHMYTGIISQLIVICMI